MIRKNKKGNLMDHVPNIIIAVVCLVLLLGLVVLVYRVLANDEYKSAQKTIQAIESKIGAIREGEITTFPIQSPCKKAECKWFIRAWDKEDPASDKPDRCYFDSCICICKDETGNPKNDCQSSATGICRNVNSDILLIKSTAPVKKYISGIGGGGNVPATPAPVINTIENCKTIQLGNKLAEITLKKSLEGGKMKLEILSSSSETLSESQCNPL